MSVNASGSFGASLGSRQRFPPEYLAKQLPIFQEKVPRGMQGPLKYPTNAPSNLPVPPLLPGETVLLQQHRVVCTDCFSEPAVGSVYVTNFRVIFNGNSISDPESRDTMLEGLPVKKDSYAAEGAKLPRAALIKLRSKQPGQSAATFNSYLTNPDQKVPNKTGIQSKSKWQGFQTKLGSLRRQNRSCSENNMAAISRGKSSSLHRMPKDSTDGAGNSMEQVVSELGSVFTRGAQSLRVTGKRMGLVVKESTRWDSVSSVSSVSELSECPTTGTDETGEQNHDRENLSPVPLEPPAFVVGSIETTISGVSMNGSVPNGSGCPIPTVLLPETPFSSLNTEDSGINMTDPLSDSWQVPGNQGHMGGMAKQEEIDFEKYSSTALVLNPILETEAQRLDLESSVDPSLLMDPSLEKKRQEHTRRSWFRKNHSPTSPESASEDDSEDERNRTLTQEPSAEAILVPGYSKVEILDTIPTPSAESGFSHLPQTVMSAPSAFSSPSQQRTGSQGAVTSLADASSKGITPIIAISPSEENSATRRKPLPPTPPKKPQTFPTSGSEEETRMKSEVKEEEEEEDEEDEEEEEEEVAEEREDKDEVGAGEQGKGGADQSREYANLAVLKQQAAKRGWERRERSSSNPAPTKKPKPLPRKGGTLDRLDSKDNVFGSSLPADFRPTPPPCKPTLTNSSPASSPQSSQVLPLVQPHTPNTPDPDTPNSPDPHTPNTPDTGSSTGSASSPQVAEGKAPKQNSPVPPPRRRRGAKTTPTRHVLSPIYSPPPPPVNREANNMAAQTCSSPVKSVGVSSDTGSSDVDGKWGDRHDTSSESELSNPRYRHTQSSPDPRSLSPVSPEWLEDDTRNSSLIAQRHSIPSYRGSLPQSPFDVPSTFGYVGDRDTLHSSVPYMSSPRQHPRAHSPLPTSTRYTYSSSLTLTSIHSIKKLPPVFLRDDSIRLPEGVFIKTRNFRCLKLHIHPHNTYDAEGLKDVLERRILADRRPQELFAFQYCAAIRHPNPSFLHTTCLNNFFRLQDELERMKLTGSQVWNVTSILKENPDLCPTYPSEVIIPRCIPEMDLIRGAKLYLHGRFPTLTWSGQDGCVFLLRAAPTVMHRGQSGCDMRLDETIMQAVCVSTEMAQGSTRLYIFTEKPDSPTALSDPMHTSLSQAQKRAYYYQNCRFEYKVAPPTHKNTRHSFNKLSAILEENKVGEDEFLIALDDTCWLHRIQELLQTSSEVCRKLDQELASVLVSYDSGWDRTTQIISLAQLLLDPYYRTMDGFQVLVQKEWLWFGHPFQSRHNRPGKVKEDGPIFLQWVDCVWQVMQQCPSAFEFNEKFLMVLVESSYSSQFGTFLMNSEKERHKTFPDEAHKHMSVATHSISFWMWVSMVNAAGRTFYNELYDPDTYPWVIYPNCTVPCLKLWTSHYCPRKLQEYSSTASALEKQLEQLVQEYRKLSGQVNVPVSSMAMRTMSVSPPPLLLSDNNHRVSRSSPMLERVPVRHSGRATRSKTPVLYHAITQYLAAQGIDSSVCKHAEISGNTCQGYLIKLGGVRKNWQERWFVLDFSSQLLTYFENREAYTATDRGTPKGVVGLRDMTRVWQNTKKKDHLVKHVFTVETKNRTYLFRAPSLITMELWMAVLNMPPSVLQVES